MVLAIMYLAVASVLKSLSDVWPLVGPIFALNTVLTDEDSFLEHERFYC